MKYYILIGLTMLALLATGKRRSVKFGIGYHKNFGIPHAANIKALEDKVFLNRAGEYIDKTDPYSDDWIFGGEAIRTHPYMGGLLIDITTGRVSVCGSSLLTQNRLVTAAHCWWDGRRQARRFTVVLGSSWLFYGGTRIKTSHVVMHPQWNTEELVNNIAIIYLPGNLWFSATIHPIALPSPDQDWNQLNDEWVTAVGYKRRYRTDGLSNYSVISQVKLQVTSVNQCRDFFPHWTHSKNICTSGAGDVNICNGNSGGPLLANRSGLVVLIGITSFMPHFCQLEYPFVFTRVTRYYNFILRHLQF